MSRNDLNKVMTGLDKPAPFVASHAPVITFSAEWVREFPRRPYYEQEIEKAMWRQEKSVELCYRRRELAIAVMKRLELLGFTVGPVHSRRNEVQEFFFNVSW